MALTVVSAGAQNFIPMKKGTTLEYKYYDANNKPLRDEWRNERFLTFTVEDVWGDSVANVVIENQTSRWLDNNRIMKPVMDQFAYGDVRVSDNEVVLDNVLWVWNWLPEMLQEAPQEIPDEMPDIKFDVTLSAASKLPKIMNKGDELPSERYSATFKEQADHEEIARRREDIATDRDYEGIPLFEPRYIWEMRVSATNRKVEGSERVKTPAGEWDCVKISYTLVGPSERALGIPIITHSFNSETGGYDTTINEPEPPLMFQYIDYISPEVGLVKREKMNFRGKKVEEMMVLTKITD